MSNVAIGFVGLGVCLTLIALRLPIGVALGLVSFVGIAQLLGMQAAWGLFTTVPYRFVGEWTLSAVPMFLFMGYIASTSGLTVGLFRAMRMLLSRLPGGLAVASVAACGLFAAASGSSVATAAAMGRIAAPEMMRYGYHPSLASGVIAASGTLGSLLPPSILMILYGYFAEASIAMLFAAGVLPGLLSMLLYMAMISVRVTLNPQLAPPVKETFTRQEKIQVWAEVWPLPVLVAGVLLGITFGVFSPTEGGAAGALLALVAALVNGKLTWPVLRSAVYQTLSSSGSIFLLVIGTVLLTRFMAISGVPTFLATTFIQFGTGDILILLSVSALYLLLGMFVDSIGLLLLTLPIVLPIAREAGMDIIWFGIIVIKLLEMGMITPPVGLNVYVIKGALGRLVTLPQVFHGALWFLVMDIVALVLLVLMPSIVLYLPGLLR